MRIKGKIDSHLSLRKFIIDNGYDFNTKPTKKEIMEIDIDVRLDIVYSIPKLENYLLTYEELGKLVR